MTLDTAIITISILLVAAICYIGGYIVGSLKLNTAWTVAFMKHLSEYHAEETTIELELENTIPFVKTKSNVTFKK